MEKLAIQGGAAVRTKPWPKWPQWGDSERERLNRVLESEVWGGFNEQVDEFEQAFAKLHKAKHCIAAANGTLTLQAALQVVGVGHGDEVIVPPYTFIATASAVRVVGATPVFVDVEPDTYNLDVSKVEEAITPRTKAIIPVHFAGLPVDMDALMPLAKKHGLYVIEDAAHAHGSTWHGTPMGTIGHIGSFSLQASKNLNAGEGGILLSNDDELGTKLRSYVNCGRSLDGLWYEHPNLGSNLRMTGWQAGILMAQLERFDAQLQRRQESARRLYAILEEIDGLDAMRWDPRCEVHAHHVYMLRYNEEGFGDLPRDKFVAAMRAEGVPISPGYAVPLYKQPPLDERYSRIMPCPVSEQAVKESLWLSQSLLLAEPDEMDDVAKAIVKVREHVDDLRD
jgi:dTDP-4-amino-4,6-dideoxygalactose transaminase